MASYTFRFGDVCRVMVHEVIFPQGIPVVLFQTLDYAGGHDCMWPRGAGGCMHRAYTWLVG